MTRSLRTAPGRIAAALVALAMLMAIPLTFGPGKADAQGAPSAPLPAVTVETVTPSPFVREARYTGELASPASVAIVSRVEGILGPLNVEDGATVARGDLLYTIGDAEFQAALAVAKANLTSAQAAETLAKSNLDRAQTLAKRNTVSEATVDADQAAYDQAVAARKVAEANLQIAELNLGYTSIASPLDGRIGTQAFREGALVSESSGPLVTVVSTDPMRVRFAVPQRDVLRARSAATAPGSAPTIALILADGSRYAAEAKILYTEPEAATATDSVAIVAEVENPDGHLLDGQLVTVAVSQSVSEDAITVPQTAVLRDTDGPYVLTVDDAAKVAEARVTLGDSIGQRVDVADGLSAGARVIVVGQTKVRPGMEVATAAAAQASSAGRASDVAQKASPDVALAPASQSAVAARAPVGADQGSGPNTSAAKNGAARGGQSSAARN